MVSSGAAALFLCTLLSISHGRHVYFIDSGAGTIKKASMEGQTASLPLDATNGQDVETVLSSLGQPMGISASGDMFYYRLVFSGPGMAFEMGSIGNLKALPLSDSRLTGAWVARSSITTANGDVIFAVWGSPSGLYRYSKTAVGGFDFVFLAASACPDSLTMSQDETFLFWTDICDGSVRSISMHNYPRDPVGPALVLIDSLIQPRGVAVDEDLTKLFVVANHAIMSADLSDFTVVQLRSPRASNLQAIAGGEDAGVAAPSGLVVDGCGTKKIYWTDMCTGKIQRANYNGSQPEDVVVGLQGPTSLAILCPPGVTTSTTNTTTVVTTTTTNTTYTTTNRATSRNRRLAQVSTTTTNATSSTATTSTTNSTTTTTTTTLMCSCSLPLTAVETYAEVMTFESIIALEPAIASCTTTTTTLTPTTTTTTLDASLICAAPNVSNGVLKLTAGKLGPTALWTLYCDDNYMPTGGENTAFCNYTTGKIPKVPTCEAEVLCTFTDEDALKHTAGNLVEGTTCQSGMSHGATCEATCSQNGTEAANIIKCHSGKLIDWSACMEGVTAEPITKIVVELNIGLSAEPSEAVLTESLALTVGVNSQWIMDVFFKVVSKRRLTDQRRLQSVKAVYSLGFSIVVPPGAEQSDLLKTVQAFSSGSSAASRRLTSEMKTRGLTVSSIALAKPPITVQSVILRDASGAIIKPKSKAYSSSTELTTTSAPDSSKSSSTDEDSKNGELMGGIIGGIAGFLIVTLTAVYLCRKPSKAEIEKATG